MKTERPNNRIRFTDKQRNWLIVLICVLMAAVIAVLVLLLRTETQRTIDEPVYQFSVNKKYEFASGTKLVVGKRDTEIETDEERVTSDATPLYYQNSPKLILMRDESWLDTVSGYEWRVPEFSYLFLDENNVIRCETSKQQIQLGGGILNDGAGTYLFLDKGVLTVNGREIPVDTFSFCSVIAGNIRVYSYGENDVISEQKGSENILFSAAAGYSVDLTSGIFYGRDEVFRLLVASPSVLQSVDERG